MCLAAQLCFVWGLNDLDWNASVHNLLSKLKKKSLATQNNTIQAKKAHQARDFGKILADLLDQRAVYLKS